MKQLLLAVLFGLAVCTPMVMSQTSGFSQQGKVTHELRDDGYSIAHSSLPLNSKARIANTSTGKEVEVTITRLIPASPSRIADVSSNVWQELGLTSDTDARIYTIVTAKPQAAAPQTATAQAAAPQTTAPQTTTAQTAAPQTVASAAARTVQGGTTSDPLGNLPSGIKFENNNNFIINGNPAVPSVAASETRTQQAGAQPAVTYNTQPTPPSVIYNTQPASPAVTYNTQPAPPAVTYNTQPTQPSVTYNTQPAQPSVTYNTQPAQPSVTYNTQPGQPAVTYNTQPGQPSVTYNTRSAQPSVTYDTRPQQGQPAAAFDMRSQPAQASVTYYPQQALPVVNIENRTLPAPHLAPPAQPVSSAVVYDSRWQPAQPSVVIENRMPARPYETQAQPVITYETRAQTAPVIPAEKLPEIRSNMVNEIVSPATRTLVFIDASPDTPVPSVTIDNGPQSYRSVLQERD